MFAGQTLNVIDPDGGVAAGSEATGNAYSVTAETGDLSVRSSQISAGPVAGQTNVAVHGWSPVNSVSTTSVGNAGDIAALAGSVEAGVRQSVGYAGDVWAGAAITTSHSTTVDTNVSAKALGNTHGFYTGRTAGVAIVQKNHAATNAGVEADIVHVDGHASLAADAVGNSVSAYGGATSLESWQTRDGHAQTGARVRADIANGQTVDASARSTANSLSAVHDAPSLRVLADQSNGNGVQATTSLYVGQFGSVTGSADAVGNSIHAGVSGEQVEIDTSQFNGGWMEATAEFSGDYGYDADVAATAIGNTVTGFACSDCDATLDARNHQVNEGGVRAVANAWVGGGRTVNSKATAVGNNAAYFVTRPGH